MPRHLLVSLLVIVLLTLAPARAQQTPPAVDPGLTVLKLAETAERMVRLDLLRATLRVELVGPEPARLQAEVNQRMTDALARARGEAAVKAETGAYFAHEDRRALPSQRWRAQQTLSLSSKEAPAVLALAGALQQAGFVISGLAFELAPDSARAVEDALTEEALRRLTVRAERVAQAMGLAIVRYREIRVGLGGRPRPFLPRMTLETAATAAATQAPPVAEPSETQVQIGVEAEVLLGPTSRP